MMFVADGLDSIQTLADCLLELSFLSAALERKVYTINLSLRSHTCLLWYLSQ